MMSLGTTTSVAHALVSMVLYLALDLHALEIKDVGPHQIMITGLILIRFSDGA